MQVNIPYMDPMGICMGHFDPCSTIKQSHYRICIDLNVWAAGLRLQCWYGQPNFDRGLASIIWSLVNGLSSSLSSHSCWPVRLVLVAAAVVAVVAVFPQISKHTTNSLHVVLKLLSKRGYIYIYATNPHNALSCSGNPEKIPYICF